MTAWRNVALTLLFVIGSDESVRFGEEQDRASALLER